MGRRRVARRPAVAAAARLRPDGDDDVRDVARVRSVDSRAATIPIGRPIANTDVYLLDAHGEPVPPGVPGEIHIGGPGLATGYLGRPDLTAERFVAHPFDAAPGARLYRTGDRARYRDDGTIEFAGRVDRQVKIRGHRIEPGEVEAALARLPNVREAVVVMHGETSETRRLTAYVVPAKDAQAEPADLWRDLRRSLPEYMIPAGIVMLAALPLTPNGKIDRPALPDPVDLVEQRKGFHVPPRDPLEFAIASIWRRSARTSRASACATTSSSSAAIRCSPSRMMAARREGLRQRAFRSRRCSASRRSSVSRSRCAARRAHRDRWRCR